jgi:hypothetical protein
LLKEKGLGPRRCLKDLREDGLCLLACRSPLVYVACLATRDAIELHHVVYI